MIHNKIKATVITKKAIENTEEFKYIMDRIEDRAKVGYDYVLMDNEILTRICKFSIKKYLLHLGFSVCDNNHTMDKKRWNISWEF